MQNNGHVTKLFIVYESNSLFLFLSFFAKKINKRSIMILAVVCWGEEKMWGAGTTVFLFIFISFLQRK